jgi:hypothetical protein
MTIYSLYTTRYMRRYTLIFSILFCICAHISFGQNVLQINDLSSNKTIKVKKGDNVQFYYALPGEESIFIYGVVRQITNSHVLLSNGAEVSLDRILNVDRVPVGRSLPLAALFGIGMGVVGVATGGTALVAAIAGTPAITFTLLHTLKYNRRHLRRNEVGRTVEIQVVNTVSSLEYGMLR